MRLVFILNVFAIGLNNGRDSLDIPSPVLDPARCRQATISFICNPDSVLTNEQANNLNRSVTDIYHSTLCPCSPEACGPDNYGYPIGIAVVKNMQPGASVRTVPATNGDGGEAARLDATLSSARTFANTLLASWQIGRCKESVLIFYSQDDNVYYTAVDSLASVKLTSDLVGEIASNARMSFATNVSQGLMNLLKDYRAVFVGNYKRTTNWQSSGNEPRIAGVVSCASTILSISTQIHIISLLAIIILSFCNSRLSATVSISLTHCTAR